MVGVIQAFQFAVIPLHYEIQIALLKVVTLLFRTPLPNYITVNSRMYATRYAIRNVSELPELNVHMSPSINTDPHC